MQKQPQFGSTQFPSCVQENQKQQEQQVINQIENEQFCNILTGAGKESPDDILNALLTVTREIQDYFYQLQQDETLKKEQCIGFGKLKERYDLCKTQINQLSIINKELLQRKVENEQKLQKVSSLLENCQNRQKMIERAIIGKMNCNINGIDCTKYNQMALQFQNAQQVLTCSGQNLNQLMDELTNLVAQFQQKIEHV